MDNNAGLKTYRFATNTRIVGYESTNLNQARMAFQRDHGYWPDKEIIDEPERSSEAEASS